MKSIFLSIFFVTQVALLCTINSKVDPEVLNAIAPAAASTEDSQLSLMIIKDQNWHLLRSFLHKIKTVFGISHFIETGTLDGATAFEASHVFDQVDTVELSQELFEKAQSFLSCRQNVTCHQGESPEFLLTLLSTTKQPCILWLDAHYSGGPTAHGKRSTPIVQELEAVAHTGHTQDIILIDDIRQFYNNTDDYPSLSNLIKLVLGINKNYKIITSGDILIAWPPEYTINVSPIAHATTMARLFYEDNTAGININSQEQLISQATGPEKDAIIWLEQNLSWQEDSGVNHGAYRRWATLFTH